MKEAELAILIRGLLQDLGYKAEPIGDDSVGSAASGLKFYIVCYEENFQFRSVLVLNERNDWNEFINNFNAETRFVKAYHKEQSELILEADWWLDQNETNYSDQFERIIGFWELSLAQIKERFRKLKPILLKETDSV